MKSTRIAMALLVINFVAIKIGLKDFPPFLLSALVLTLIGLLFIVCSPKSLPQVNARAARP